MQLNRRSDGHDPLAFPEPQTWVQTNFAPADLGDKRRTRRLVETAAQLAHQPEGSLPEHFSWNPLRAVSRLCNRPEVSHPAVTDTHFALTRDQMERALTTILILQDTTELNFTSHYALEGTGPVGNGQGRGFLQHNSLAIEADTRRSLFQKAGFDPDRVVECHGSIEHRQCLDHCGVGIFDAGPTEVAVGLSTFRAIDPLPTCPNCGALARPNILMFGD